MSPLARRTVEATTLVLLALTAVYGIASRGPWSFRARFRRLASETTNGQGRPTAGESESEDPQVTEGDLTHLPPPVAAYVRACGAVGRPHVVGFHADISGRIRGGADQPWMRWHGEQVNTYGPEPTRVFFMAARMRGVPTDVLHAFVGPHATMQVRVASLLPIVDAHGPEMDRAETVTLLNDLCVLAPAALVDAPIEWTALDDRHARATFTRAGQTVSALLFFDESNELVDFVSDDRLRSSPDGRTFTPQRWSTPITDHRGVDGRRVGTLGTGRWHPEDEPALTYLEFRVDDIRYLTSVDQTLTAPAAYRVGSAR